MTKKTRIAKIASAGAAGLLLAGCAGGNGDFPNGNISMIIPYGAGGNIDSFIRIINPCLETQWDGANIQVQYQPGSSGTIGTSEIVNAKPDGHTLGVTNVAPAVLGPEFIEGVSYKTEDLQYFGFVSEAPMLLFVKADSEYQDLQSVVNASKSGSISAAAPGADSIQALLVRKLNEKSGAKINVVPTDQTNEIVRGVQQGDYTLGVTTTSMDILPLIEDGSIRVLARGGDSEYEHLEGIPTLEEAGFSDLLPSTNTTFPLVAPAGVPEEVATTISDGLKTCVEDEEVREKIGPELLSPAYVDGETVLNQYKELGEAIRSTDS